MFFGLIFVSPIALILFLSLIALMLFLSNDKRWEGMIRRLKEENEDLVEGV